MVNLREDGPVDADIEPTREYGYVDVDDDEVGVGVDYLHSEQVLFAGKDVDARGPERGVFKGND